MAKTSLNIFFSVVTYVYINPQKGEFYQYICYCFYSVITRKRFDRFSLVLTSNPARLRREVLLILGFPLL